MFPLEKSESSQLFSSWPLPQFRLPPIVLLVPLEVEPGISQVLDEARLELGERVMGKVPIEPHSQGFTCIDHSSTLFLQEMSVFRVVFRSLKVISAIFGQSDSRSWPSNAMLGFRSTKNSFSAEQGFLWC